jgi:hypothetical protein
VVVAEELHWERGRTAAPSRAARTGRSAGGALPSGAHHRRSRAGPSWIPCTRAVSSRLAPAQNAARRGNRGRFDRAVNGTRWRKAPRGERRCPTSRAAEVRAGRGGRSGGGRRGARRAAERGGAPGARRRAPARRAHAPPARAPRRARRAAGDRQPRQQDGAPHGARAAAAARRAAGAAWRSTHAAPMRRPCSAHAQRGPRTPASLQPWHAAAAAPTGQARSDPNPKRTPQVVTVVSSEEARSYGDALLAPYAAQPLPPPATGRPVPLVLVKGDRRLADVISDHAEACRADLVVCGSHNLCVQGARRPPAVRPCRANRSGRAASVLQAPAAAPSPSQRPRRRARHAPAGTRDAPLPASGSFALRLVRDVRSCPLLVVKSNNLGHFLQSGSAAAGLRVMVDCQVGRRASGRGQSRRRTPWQSRRGARMGDCWCGTGRQVRSGRQLAACPRLRFSPFDPSRVRSQTRATCCLG